MTFTPALAAGNYTKLRSVSYAAAQHVSLCPNTNILASTVSAVPATITVAQVTLNDAPAGVRAGQTVLISETNDRRRAFFRGRIRKAPAGNVIYINETSANISVNDYVWILDDYDLHAKLPVDDGTDYDKDFDEAFHFPNPILYNLPSSIAGFENIAGFLQIAFAPLYILPNPDATVISTWLWEEGDGTYVVGNAASQNPTIKFPAGFRWVHVTATDDIGRSQTFHIQVHSHDPEGPQASYPPELDFRGSEIFDTVTNGWSASLGAFAGVSDVLDRTAVTIWSQEYYGGVEGNLYSQAGRVEFTGRLRSESNIGTGDEAYSFLTEVSFPGEGIGSRLAELSALPLAIRDIIAPDEWDEIEDLTVWRAIVHYLDTMTTFCTIHSLSFDSVADTFRAKELGTSGDGVLDVVNDLAKSINAAMEFGPDGQTQIIRNARYLTQAARDALTTLADFEEQDLIDLTLDRDYMVPQGQVDASGGVYNTASGYVSVAFSIAPGHARDEGAALARLPGQILEADTTLNTARTELNFRSGQHFVAVNPIDTLSVKPPPGYFNFVASNGAYFTWVLNGTQNVRGLVYTDTDLWLLSSLSFAHDNEMGARETELVFQAIGKAAQSGDTYIPATVEQITNPYTNMPLNPIYPGVMENVLVDPKNSEWPTVADWQTNGQTVAVATANHLWIVHGYLGNEPAYVDVTPSPGDEVKAFQFGYDGSRAYCLVFDGGESYVYTTAEIKDAFVVWIQGAALSDEWDVLRLGDTEGELYVYQKTSPVTGDWTETFDFTLSDGGWIQYAANPHGVYDPGVGWRAELAGNWRCNIQRNFAASTITDSFLTFTATNIASGPIARIMGRDGDQAETDLPDGIGTFTFHDLRTTAGSTSVEFELDAINVGDIIITSATISGTGVNPFVASGQAITRYSVDHGMSFDVSTVVGTACTNEGGLDTIKVGGVVLAGQSAKVRTATDGGAYGDETNGAVAGSNPTLLVIPISQFNSSIQNINDATPEYLLGVDVAVGGASLWRVTDAGKTDVSITIVAVLTLITHPNAGHFCWHDNGKFVVLVNRSGTMHLVTTTDSFTANMDRGAIDADAIYVRMNKADLAGAQLFLADGGAGPAYSLNFGADIINQPWPTTDDVIIIEPYSGMG